MAKIYNQFYYENASPSEQKFLEEYRPAAYERPSVTADIVIFTVNPAGKPCVVLIKRNDYPYRGHWALPGGFLKCGEETIYETAIRELKEETGLGRVFLQQLRTYSDPSRDPRMHVISVAHFALIPWSKLQSLEAGDDAGEVGLFEIRSCYYSDGGDEVYGYLFSKEFNNSVITLTEQSFAFDHYNIITEALTRVYGRKDYCLDLFNLLENPKQFTISDYKRIYTAFSFDSNSDSANFRKMFLNRYVKTGIVNDLGCKSTDGRNAELFCLNHGN